MHQFQIIVEGIQYSRPYCGKTRFNCMWTTKAQTKLCSRISTIKTMITTIGLNKQKKSV